MSLPAICRQKFLISCHPGKGRLPLIHLACFYLGHPKSEGCTPHQRIISHLGDGTLKTGNRISVSFIFVLNNRRPVFGHSSESIIIILRKCEKPFLCRIGLHARLNKARTSFRLVFALLRVKPGNRCHPQSNRSEQGEERVLILIPHLGGIVGTFGCLVRSQALNGLFLFGRRLIFWVFVFGFFVGHGAYQGKRNIISKFPLKSTHHSPPISMLK